MAALRPIYRPPLAYQSASLATSWALGNFDARFPVDPNGPLTHTGEQFTGARFPDGRVEVMQGRMFTSLVTARAIASRQTLHERHVNLESRTGQFLKRSMGLPFQEHSRVDPLAAAGQALKAFGLGKLFGGGEKDELDLAREVMGGVRVFRGFDPNDAFKGQAVTRLAEAEIWAHGAPKGPSQDWHLLGAGKTAQPTTDVVRRLIEQEKVQSVLIDSCNAGKSVIATPKGATVTYGLGYGVASNTERQGIGAVRSWLDAVVVSEGDTAKVYSKSAIQAHLEQRGLDVLSLPTHQLRSIKGDFLEGDTSTLGLFKTAAGETRLTAFPIGETAQDVMKYSLALNEAPAITLRHGKGGPTFEAGGKTFSSFEEASSSLTQSIRSRTRSTTGANRLLSAAGIQREQSALKSFVEGSNAPAVGSVASSARREARSAFHGGVLLGVLAVGSLLAGGLLLSHRHPAQARSTGNRHPVPPPMTREHEQQTVETRTERRQGGNPRSHTRIRLTDADLNMEEVDRLFANHLKRGYAYS